jgi:hypothetical protein
MPHLVSNILPFITNFLLNVSAIANSNVRYYVMDPVFFPVLNIFLCWFYSHELHCIFS